MAKDSKKQKVRGSGYFFSLRINGLAQYGDTAYGSGDDEIYYLPFAALLALLATGGALEGGSKTWLWFGALRV